MNFLKDSIDRISKIRELNELLNTKLSAKEKDYVELKQLTNEFKHLYFESERKQGEM